MRHKASLGLSIIAITSLLLSGCSNKIDESAVTSDSAESVYAEDASYQEHIPGRTGYRESICTIEPYADDLLSTFEDITYRDGMYEIIYLHNVIGSIQPDSVKVYKVNDDGEIVSTIDLEEPTGFFYRFVGDRIVEVSQRSVKFYSIDDGSVIGESDIVTGYNSGINAYRDGFVIFTPGKVTYYDIDGNELGRVEDPSLQMYQTSSVFEIDNTTYAFVEDMGCSFIAEINFDNGYCNYICDVNRLGVSFTQCFGKYIFDDVGGYVMNLDGEEPEYFVEWFNTDIRPSMFSYASKYTVIDPDHFAVTNGTIEESYIIQLFEYDSSIDYSDRTLLTVGGLSVESYILKYAIYEYNRSQDEYRVRTTQYEYDGNFTPTEMSNFTTQLISQFNTGNAPDIFFGNDFDYEYFGRNGLVINMLPYLEASPNFHAEDLYPSVWNLMCHDDTCYQIFSSFALTGYFSRDDMGISTDMTYQELYSLSDDVTSITGPEYSRNIVGNIINYSFVHLIDEEGNLTITYDQVQDIVNLALAVGLPDSAPFTFVENSWVATGDVMMTNVFIPNVATYSTLCDDFCGIAQFVGHPGIDSSTHLIYPNENAAISASTEYPEACADFLSYFFSDEVQRMTGSIPVSRRIHEEFCDYAMNTSNYDSNTTYDLLLEYQGAVTTERVEAFFDVINSVDTLQLYDYTVYGIISDELAMYETQGKTPEIIADSLFNRLTLYVDENY